MKIGFNVNPLQNENRKRGTGSYTNSLLKALKKLAGNEFEIIEFTDKVSDNADLVHYPFFDPFFLTLPIIKKKPTVVTVHDLIPLKFPDKFPRGLKGEIKWQIQKLSLQSASAVITDSVSSAKDVKELIGIKEGKIFPIPLAADAVFRPITDKSKLDKARKKYNLPEKFILYVGDVNWNKNVMGLIKAFATIRHSGEERSDDSRIKNGFWASPSTSSSPSLRVEDPSSGPRGQNDGKRNEQIKLVFVSSSFLNNSLPETKEIDQLINQLRIADYVLRLGFVPQEDLIVIYNLASVYVQPSFYEGFGLPVLEALSCGCPVVCANTSSLPEVGGDAVLYFDPYDEEDMVNKMNTILHFDDSNHRSSIENGLEQAKKFSWEKTAKETLRIYEKVC